MATFIVHNCRNHHCVCPIHKMDLAYWPDGDEHFCQDPDCKYAHGYESVLKKEMMEYWTTGPGSRPIRVM